MTAPALPELPLKDIHLPAPISAWPPAYGWWWLAGLILVLMCAALFFVKRYRQQRAYRRAALSLAQDIFKRYEQHHDQPALAADCSALLRRVSVTAYGATGASITGARWLDFLDAKIAHKSNAPLFRQQQDALLKAPYQPAAGFSVEALNQAVFFWIRHHRA